MRSSPTAPMTGCATTPCAPRPCWSSPPTGSISTRPGTAMRGSIRCIVTISPCAATRRSIKGPTVFATHSTHKLLAALSQASFTHVRDGKGAIDHHRFNQAYMMHTTTSPLYAIVASNDITSAMMDGSGGRSLTQEAIKEAVDFRQVVGRMQRTFADKKDWFFKPWNVDTVKADKRSVAFEDAPAELLCTDPRSRGSCGLATTGTASMISPTAGACSIRSRSASWRREWARTASSKRPACRRRWSMPGSTASASCRPA